MRQLNERRAVVLDSHPVWIEAIQRVLGQIGIETVAATASADAATAALGQETADLLVVGSDLDGAGTSGLDVARSSRARFPEISIVVLGDDSSAAGVAAAMEAGANAYVLRRVHPDDLASAVRQSLGRSIYFAGSSAPERAVPAARGATPSDARLTRREVEILRLVAEGYSNGALARLLWVTEQTVKFHLSNIYRKLGVANRTEASRWAQLNGLLNVETGGSAERVGQHPLVGAAT